MEERKKAIEEEAKNHACIIASTIRNKNERDMAKYVADCTINFILSKWEESERWRKVEDELPEVKEEEYFILCKMDSSQKYSIVLVHCEIDFKRYFRVFNITEWQPINK